jgi:hypothetical protein
MYYGMHTSFVKFVVSVCAADPNRPRHHFAAQQSPAAHVANEHDWHELDIADDGLLQQTKRVSGD